MKRVAINGLGRIGRMVLRNYVLARPTNVEIVAANASAPIEDLAYLIRYDSIHQRMPLPVVVDKDTIRIGDFALIITAERDPAKLPLKSLDIDVVVDCTGHFTKRELAARHLEAGARRVIIAAPAQDADITIILGVNESEFHPESHRVISTGSCTSNALIPALKILLDNFGVERAMVTTIHAYTASQALVDKYDRDRPRGRAAAVSLVPSTTGADTTTALVLPELQGKIKASSIRAPIPDGAITDIIADLKKSVTREEVNDAFKSAAERQMKGILGYNEDDIVSADIIGDLHSGIIHSLSTSVVQEKMVKVQVWYDNEYGYSRRLLDVIERLPL